MTEPLNPRQVCDPSGDLGFATATTKRRRASPSGVAGKAGAESVAQPAPPAPLTQLHAIARHIRGIQDRDGAIRWEHRREFDPWDHIEAAMGLAVAGDTTAAAAAYRFLAANQRADGAWWASYDSELRPTATHVETHHAAYFATGVWHLHLRRANPGFLALLWPAVRRALDFVCRHQARSGEVYWAVSADDAVYRDALLAANASIYLSLGSGLAIARALGQAQGHWAEARQRLGRALRSGDGFDRTWASKRRFAMDWYYPVLSGALDRRGGYARIVEHWDRFVHREMGCRCVDDQPWITVAETAELALALARIGEIGSARKLLTAIAPLQATDGGFWTGVVLPERMLWPNERTTWTGGAVALALDSCYQLTSAASWFLAPDDPA